MNEPASPLRLRGIVKEFGAFRALDGVDLELHAGEIHALCGENGAGKSTLARIAAGKLSATQGTIEAAGPVGLVHQHFELVERLRVWENVVLGREPRRGTAIDANAARERVRELARRNKLEVDPDAVIEALPVGIGQRVEILRELAREPRVLILDEPTAVLAQAEIEGLFTTLRDLAARGVAIGVITHKLREVVGYADRITVIRAGKIVSSRGAAGATVESIAREMVGGEIPALAARERTALRDVLHVSDLRAGSGAHALHAASFEVRGGEIVGIAGVEGNGQSALTDALAGIVPYEGTLTLQGRALRGTPAQRLAAGIRIIPQDRIHEGLVLGWTIAENAALGAHRERALRRGAVVDRGARDALARRVVAEFDVRAPSLDVPVSALSGGNQQKVVAGRALCAGAPFVLAYQPTRGVDVSAAALLHSRLIEARNAGTAILLVSFDLDEILTLADRIIVLYDGRIAGEFSRDTARRERIGELMAGAA